MVFGWGRRARGGPPAQAPAERRVTLAGARTEAAGLVEARESRAVSEVRSLRDATAPLIEDLAGIGRAIEADELEVDELDRRLATAAVRGKGQVVGAIRRDVAPLPAVSSLDDAAALDAYLKQVLKKLGDVLGRQAKIVHVFAKKNAGPLRSTLEAVTANHRKMQDVLKSHGADRELLGELNGVLDRAEGLAAAVSGGRARLASAEDELGRLAGQASSLEAGIAAEKSSPAYAEYGRLRGSLEAVSAREAATRAAVSSQFARVSRPLSRYRYVSSLEKDQKAVLAALVDDPAGVLLPENTDAIITILENVRKGVSSGSISVKDTAKSLSHITETEESLAGLASRMAAHRDERARLQREAESCDLGRLASLEADLKKCHSHRDSLQKRASEIAAEVAGAESKMPALASEAEGMLRRLSNTRYVVERQN